MCCAALPALAAPPTLDIAAAPLTAACLTSSAGGPALQRGAPAVGAVRGAGAVDVFQPEYDMRDWSGHFARYTLAVQGGGGSGAGSGISADPGNGLAITSGAVLWDAAAMLTGDQLQAGRPQPGLRNIHTSAINADGTLVSIPFEWDALTPQQRSALDRAPASLGSLRSRPDGLGQQRLAYLRGERGLEGTIFRRRTSLLGDSVHAAAVLVGPASAAGQGVDYAAFFQRSKARRPMVYLGANDGMLHAFDAADGSERYAYVPEALIASLNELSSPAYLHRAYVDGPASAGEVYLDGHWKTVLVSGMGGGAQGVFALDVSDPEQLGRGTALWEFTDRDDPMIGNVTGLPQLARLRVRLSKDDADFRHFAIVASGMNNYDDDGHRSAAGKGALFLLALDKQADAPWRLNHNYYRLQTPIAEPTQANALGPPALVPDRDGALRYAYAGDLQGNLWRFDFDGNAPWSNAVGPGAGKAPLFVARDALGRRQPIAQQPKVVFTADGGYLILFGTGRMIELADRRPADFSAQSLYGIRDGLESPAQLVGGRKDLSQRWLRSLPGQDGYAIEAAQFDADSKGWFMDFPDSQSAGERSVAAGVLQGGRLFFNTLLPGRDPCAAAGGRSYVVDALAGTAAATAVLQPDYPSAAPLLLRTATSSGSPVPSGQISSTRSVAIVNFSGAGSVKAGLAGKVKVLRQAGRLSWREVANWRELHAAAKK
ncbi:pilus assembly protein PilY [Oxalobacteraceae bacterium]|nr:pilus assembly protein PilY [Oxalobacteraceae bacterium]